MKKNFLFTMLLIVSIASFCQQTNPSSLTKTDYLQKSKHQKTAAWIMLGGDVAIGVAGIAVSASNWESSGGDVLLVIGGAAMVSSAPLFIAAARNKRKAMAASAFFEN
jgi:hypothetical protein